MLDSIYLYIKSVRMILVTLEIEIENNCCGDERSLRYRTISKEDLNIQRRGKQNL